MNLCVQGINNGNIKKQHDIKSRNDNGKYLIFNYDLLFNRI